MPCHTSDMLAPVRRRVDLTRLPALLQVALAFCVVVAVVGIVLMVRADESTDPATWYSVVVRIGAALLLVYAAFWLIRRVVSLHQDRHPTSRRD